MKQSISKGVIISSLLFIGIASVSFAQTDSRGFSFQGYALDANNGALGSENINVRFSIYQVGGSDDYTEVHTTQTDPYGVFSLSIGSVTPAEFNKLNFSMNDYWLKVEVKKTTDGVYTEISNARLNAVPYARSAANGVPVGTILPFAGPKANIPDGWLVCDGSQISSSAYPQLYAAIGNAWGGTFTHFRVPDLRGMFLRGVAEGQSTDPDRNARTASSAGGNTGDNVGTKQADAFKSHDHTGSAGNAGVHQHDIKMGTSIESGTTTDQLRTAHPSAGSHYTNDNPVVEAGDHTHTLTINSRGGSETRPANASVYYIIKY